MFCQDERRFSFVSIFPPTDFSGGRRAGRSEGTAAAGGQGQVQEAEDIDKSTDGHLEHELVLQPLCLFAREPSSICGQQVCFLLTELGRRPATTSPDTA